MLCQRMHADHDVRAPALEQITHITYAARMKELERLWPETVNQPVVVLHPVLFISQQPVVDGHHYSREVMRLFDGPHHANSIRFTFDEALDAGHDRRGRGAVTTAGVGRDDEDFWTVRVHLN